MQRPITILMMMGALSWSGAARAATNPNATIIQVRCGVMTAKGGEDATECHQLDIDGEDTLGGRYIEGTLELLSGGVVVATEVNPKVVGQDDGGGEGGSVSLELTGNGDPKNFKVWYVDPATSVLNAPDLQVRVWSTDLKNTVVLFQNYRPVGSALWAMHSADSVNMQGNIDAETARAKAAEAALAQSVTAEAAARQAADNNL